MAKKRNKDSAALLAIGTAIFGVGLFLSYGMVIFTGAVVMFAGLLPPSEKEDDSL